MACSDDSRVGDGVLKPIDAEVTVDTSRPDAPDERGDVGEACVVAADCKSGLCTPSAAGAVCTDVCADQGDCAEGYVCLPDPDVGEDICWRADAVACQPCTEDAQCQVGDGAGNVCVSYGAAGSFCGLACDDQGGCPTGYSCSDDGQCLATAGECQCNRLGVVLGLGTECAVTNDHGSCPGARECTVGGLTRCVGPEPEPETCNGEDDDCDGETDEGTDGQQCTLENQFGTCVGAVACTDGEPLCVGRAPAAEVCNGVDDDCDGETDEDQPDLDLDEIPDCVDDDIDGDGSLNEDDCRPRNAAVYPGQTEVCNGVDDDCDRTIDEGTDGVVEDECGAYICAGGDGCRTDCDSDADCIAGYLCDLSDQDADGNDAECLPSVCGNGVVELRETCDDGINDGGYGGCTPDCHVGPRCGDGIVQQGHEVCDSGAGNGEPNRCDLTCSGLTPATCGNGVKEDGEDCDLGAEVNSNQPNAACRTDCSQRRCGDGVADDAFGEQCDAAVANGDTLCGCQDGCKWASVETVCRPAAGECDVAERCSGAGLDGVPPNMAATAAGVCPADVFEVATVCREAAGVCDAVERCDGASADCPSDGKLGAEEVCRASGGACDPQEVCAGDSDDCPADVILPAQTLCRAEAGPCDVAELCDGESRACPDDALRPADTVCREAAGGCDVVERCSGAAAACPDDVIAPAETVCRAAAGLCDVAEVCDGQEVACPVDELLAKDTVCHASAGPCDPPEVCDGQDSACPTDLFAAAGTVCQASLGGCDPAEECDGLSAACPDDVFYDDNTTCSAGTGNCVIEPCVCLGKECEQLCGNGEIDRTPGAGEEACDAGDINGARDGCSRMCDGKCDADFAWVRWAGGDGRDAAWAVDVSEAGATAVVGEYEVWGEFGVGAYFGDDEFGSYGTDFFVMVQDTDNTWRWSACGGGSGTDVAVGVSTDDAGAVYVTGTFAGHAEIDCGCAYGGFPNGPVAFPGRDGCETLDADNQGSDLADVFVAKWGADGVLEWAVSGGSPSEDYAGDIAASSVGDSVVVGQHRGVSGAPARFGDHAVGSPINDGSDLLVVKYDDRGVVQWAKSGGAGKGDEDANAVALDGASNAFVTGWFEREFDWDNTPGDDTNDDNVTFDLLDVPAPVLPMGSAKAGVPGGHPDSQAFVFSMSADGDVRWASTAAALDGGAMAGEDVAVDGAGNVYVVGWFTGHRAVFSNGDDNITLTSTGGELGDAEVFVAKLDRAGTWLWAAAAGSPAGTYSDDVALGVDVDRAGNAYVSGNFGARVQFGDTVLEGRGEVDFGDGPTPKGRFFDSGDGFVAKLGADGKWLWAKRMGGDGSDGATGVMVDPRGAVYLSGTFTSSTLAKPADFDDIDVGGYYGDPRPQPGPAVRSGQDAFVAKMVPDGPPRCFECGDGVLDPGETCDADGDLDHCTGACDGICFGPANFCGDGWDECAEEADLGGGNDLGVDACLMPCAPNPCVHGVCALDGSGDETCTCDENWEGDLCDQLVIGNLWCYETADNTYTVMSVAGSSEMMLGKGLLDFDAGAGLGGNPNQHPDCPTCNPADPNVDCRAGSARQWGGDSPPPLGSSYRYVCDGDFETPPCQTNQMGCASTATNDEKAAVECGDYYEFVANTGATLAFEFDERTTTQGPTRWALYVSLTGAEGDYFKVFEDNTTALPSADFGNQIATPMHRVYLTGVASPTGAPLVDSLGVHFRLYAWGAVATEAGWTVDNVYIGEPTAPEPVPVVIISEIVDGDLPGGLPKVIELTNVGNAAADLSRYALGRYINGSSSLSDRTALSGVLDAGASWVVSSESTVFKTVYDSIPDLEAQVAENNGDDTVVLFDRATGQLVDIYGVIGVDGTGTVWEYTDSWAYRNPDVLAPSSTFDALEWTFGGRSALDGVDAAGHAAVTTPGTHAYTPQ
ncbi:MAG: hypothetical protein CSA66_06335 [Proteobacteria bacterium]|nr:MAG: hypothetical protein CSA66_06335 [Pseudomonadota bacterium]